MKKRLLPVVFFTLLVAGFVAFYLMDANAGDVPSVTGEKKSLVAGQADYLSMIRNNQFTGTLDPRDVIQARMQSGSHSLYKSGNSAMDLTWAEMGPDNAGGRTRALIIDNRDATLMTLYAGGVTGGMFKTTDLGISWSKINENNGTNNLNVTCMVQDANGTIYVGTGEGLNTQPYSLYGALGYEGGFVGQGIFKSDANDNFTLVQGTEPVISGDVTEWAYINKLALDTHGNRLFAATHTGLKYATFPALSDWQSVAKYRLDSTVITRNIASDSIIVCDSFIIQNGHYVIYGLENTDYDIINDDTTATESVFGGFAEFEDPGNCFDVAVSSNGWIISTFKGFIYVSESGNPHEFYNKSIYPNNPDHVRKDMVNFTTHIVFRNSAGETLHDSTNIYSKEYNWHTNYVSLKQSVKEFLSGFPSSGNAGRASFAIAPSNADIVYAMATKSSGSKLNSLFNIYLSEDKGNSWRIIAPGGSDLLNILGSEYYNPPSTDPVMYYRGDYCNSIAVSPGDPYKVIAGSVNMWEGRKTSETGFYQWTEKSLGRVVNADGSNLLFNGIFNELYCHDNHHSYVFHPLYPDVFFVTTDGGIYVGQYFSNFDAYLFEARNKNFNVTQFYSIDISNKVKEVIGGTQSMGTQYISGTGTTPNRGEDLWRPANLDGKYPEGTDGGFAAFSNIRSYKEGDEDEKAPASFYSKSPLPRNEALIDNGNSVYRLRRSESLGYDWSINFFSGIGTAPTNTNFVTPLILWENYTNTNSRDSVYFMADHNYLAGDTLTVRSQNAKQPFHHVLDANLNSGDSLKVQDIISAKLFFAVKDNVYMTLQALQFDVSPEWFKISAKAQAGFTDNPSCMAYSTDCNYLYVGNYEGKIYRISNLINAYNHDRADVSSSECVVATSMIEVYPGNEQVITSISVDPKNADKVLITLGNYGNTDYVYYSTNATSSNPVFVSVQGDPGTTGLPLFPVYSSILEMQADNDMAMIGTEEGIWVSDNVASGEWYPAGGSIGKVPVMDLKQQTVFKKLWVIGTTDPNTNLPVYEYFYGIENYGMIYAGTHGRGVFRCEDYFVLGEQEHPVANGTNNMDLNIFPNPASGQVQVVFDLPDNRDVLIQVVDMTGKQVYTQTIEGVGNGHQTVTLDAVNWNKGSYILKLQSGENSASSKLLIVK